MWFTLESDPEVFTSLLQKNGIKSLFAKEVFDLDLIEDFPEIVAFIFLFKYAKRNCKSEFFDECENSRRIIFIPQIAENSCATVALLNVVFNIDECYLGDKLGAVKLSLNNIDAIQKGTFIAQNSDMKKAHNAHVCEEIEYMKTMLNQNTSESNSGDAFHYSALIPLAQSNGLVELDGLEKMPIVVDRSDNFWLNSAKIYIQNRISEIQTVGKSGDVRFNLIAIASSENGLIKKTKVDIASTPSSDIYSYNYIPDLIKTLKSISKSNQFAAFV